jgi:hypothetical protein
LVASLQARNLGAGEGRKDKSPEKTPRLLDDFQSAPAINLFAQVFVRPYISHKVFLNRQFPHKFINLFFLLVTVEDKLTHECLAAPAINLFAQFFVEKRGITV